MPTFYGPPSDGTVIPADLETALAADLADASTPVGDSARRAPDLIGALPSPFYIAHRGGALVGPENTSELFRIMDAAGIDVLEADLSPTADGALVAFHDSTVDRVTEGTGPVAGYSLPALRTLNVADSVPWPRPCTVVTVQELLREFKGDRVLQLEPKTAAHAEQLFDAIEAARATGSVMIETNNLTVAQAATARGLQVWFYWGSTISTPSVADVIAAGVQHLAAAANISDADVTTLVNTGLPVTVYGAHRRFDRVRFLALGVTGISGDNPVYVKNDQALQNVDSWRYGVWGHGLNSNRANMPQIEDGALVLGTTASAPEIITVGEVAPIANAAGSYTIDLDLGWKVLPSDMAKPLNVYFCIPDDRAYTYAAWNTVGGLSDSYLASLKANGQLTLQKLDAATETTGGNVAAPYATVNTPALVPGEFAHLQIEVTPTGITVTRTDTDSTPITTSDAEHRGGYIQISRHSTADGVGQFRNLAIS